MKTLLTLLLLLTSITSNADFLDASKNYQEGKFKQAFDEFIILAKFGHELSQQNVAVMLYKGEGTEKNLIQAYAWSQVLTDEKTKNQLNKLISSALSEKQLLTAQNLIQDFTDKYAHQNSKILLGPVTSDSNDSNIDKKKSNRVGARIKIKKTFPPIFPVAMWKKGIEGWVNLSFNIYPDGRVRDIAIKEEVPPNSFASEAIKAVEKYQFEFEKDGELVQINQPRLATQKIIFNIGAKRERFNDKQKQFIREVKSKANSGDVEAQYAYSVLYESYLNKESDIQPEQVNQWLFNAAQSGIHDAQYRIGKNIYYGKDCQVEKQKGLDWIMRAAQVGNAEAEFLAYQLLQDKSVINQSTQSPFYWLEQSAKNGSSVAQLNYAKEIALLDQPTETQKSLATSYLNSYADKLHKTIQWHQVNAMLRLKTDKSPKKALASINKAIKKAKAVGWDLSELETQKQQIIAAKNS